MPARRFIIIHMSILRVDVKHDQKKENAVDNAEHEHVKGFEGSHVKDDDEKGDVGAVIVI